MTRKFEIGDRVRKIGGSSWHGHVCGFYSTELTPYGYGVESERERGSVQFYPEVALEAMPDWVPDGVPDWEWRPISTVPKDGTHVLIYIPECEITHGPWIVESRYWDDPECEHCRGWWDVSIGCVDDLPGEPTHWKPLPAPPSDPKAR